MALAGSTTSKYPNGVAVGDNDVALAPIAAASIAVGAEAANVILATVTLKDADGAAIAFAGSVRAYLSDAASGLDLLDTAHSTPAAAGASGVLIPLVAGKVFDLVTTAAGVAIVSLTETGAKTAYLVVILPSGKLVVSGAITHAA